MCLISSNFRQMLQSFKKSVSLENFSERMLLTLLVLICTLLPQNWAIDYKDYCIIKVKTTHINKLNEIVKSSTNCQHLDEDMANHEDCVTLLCTNSDVKNLEKNAVKLNLTIDVMEANVHEAMNNQMIENLVSMRSLKTHKFLSTCFNVSYTVRSLRNFTLHSVEK